MSECASERASVCVCVCVCVSACVLVIIFLFCVSQSFFLRLQLCLMTPQAKHKANLTLPLKTDDFMPICQVRSILCEL